MTSRREFLTIAAAGVAAATLPTHRGVARRAENYGPNLGDDYGGRLPTAWLDR